MRNTQKISFHTFLEKLAEGLVIDVGMEIIRQSWEDLWAETILHLGFQQWDQNSQQRPSVYVRFVQMEASIIPERA
jgi:hypothetical protein